ncbi:nuclear protein UL4 [Papiine alphaherpesvirus 2]|uniref:Nuclear protein UL4 n=1 Tax=Cercopithecine herpesvirus 16 TaxID=340907 RepID=X2FIK5_CHV16|nr:nuclear protein UL4 [Papiine alphaherpesvirus 2]AHM96344.1 nuclear protein UL4 [Papiine alphaherpesvirus 2]
MCASPATIAYSLHGTATSSACVLPDAEQVVCAFESGTRAIASRGCLRHDALSRGAVVVRQTPVGLLVMVDCRTEFCAYRFVGRSERQRLERWWDTNLCAYPFDSWVSSTRGESVRSPTAGIVTVVWGEDSIYITITVYGSPPAGEGETPARPPSPPGDASGAPSPPAVSPASAETGAAADLLVEVMKEIQLSPTLGFGAYDP